MYVDENNIWHAIYVTAKGIDYGILVQSEGYGYARYSAFLRRCHVVDVQINWGKRGGFMKKNKLNGKIAQQLQKNIDYEITAVKIQPEGLIAFRNNGDGTYSKEVLKI